MCVSYPTPQNGSIPYMFSMVDTCKKSFLMSICICLILFMDAVFNDIDRCIIVYLTDSFGGHFVSMICF